MSSVNSPSLQGRRRDVSNNGLGVGEIETFVIEKEVGLAAKNFLRDKRAANRPAITAVMEAGNRNVVEVILPAIGRPVVVFIIFVSRAVPGIGSALGDHLHLGTGGTIEIGGLAGGIYFELLDAILRSGQNARSATHARSAHRWSYAILIGNTPSRVAGEALRVYVHAAVHVVGVVAAIER